VLGKIEITDQAQLRQIAKALQDGIAASDGYMLPVFEPRHAIRVIKQGREFDYVIGLSYRQMQMMSPPASPKVIPLKYTEELADLHLDSHLRKAGIPLAPRLDVLESPDQLTLYSIDPRTSKDETRETFHRYPVLGKIEMTDPAQRKEIVEAMQAGITTSELVVMACFEPRHAIRVVKQGQTLDLVICFECRAVDLEPRPIEPRSVPITRAPQKVLDRYLADAGIPLAPSALRAATEE
jgi:hypothetical protein